MDEQTNHRQNLLASLATQAWLPIAGLLAWFTLSAGSTDPYAPPLQTIFEAIATGFTSGVFWDHLTYSFTNYFAGLLLGLIAALVLGIIIGEVELIRKAFMPFLDFARATPTVAFVPVIILAFGIGAEPKIFLIALGCLWPIMLNTIEGIRNISPSIRESARAYGIPVRLRITKVILPGALPQIVVGIRIAITVGIIMMLVSEMFGAEKGLGYFITLSGANFDLPDTWAGTILIGTTGYLLSLLFSLVEHRLLRWHHQVVPAGRKGPVPSPTISPSSQLQA